MHDLPLPASHRLEARRSSGPAALLPLLRPAAFLAAITLLLISCGDGSGGSKPSGPRGVVLITIDTLRADRLGCYGNRVVETPAIDRLASHGYRFSRAVAPSSQTLPSHSAIHTGRYPHVHGARSNGVFRLPESARTLAEVLGDRGFRTGAFVSAVVLSQRYGLDQGFDEYDDELIDPLVFSGSNRLEEELGHLEKSGVSPAYFWHTARKYDKYQRRADRVTDAALAWLEDNSSEDFFLWVHYFDPHGPYNPPPPYDTKYRGKETGGGRGFVRNRLPHYQILPELKTYSDFLAAYNGEVAYTDAQIGRLLDGLESTGVDGRTMVVLTADHGESLDGHDYFFQHGDSVWEDELRVPLIVRPFSKLSPGTRTLDAHVSTIDVYPTILSMLGVEAELGESCRSLLPLIEGRRFEQRPLYSEAYVAEVLKIGSVYRTVQTPSFKLVTLGELDTSAPRMWMYELATDPGETRPIPPARMNEALSAQARSMLEELRRISRLEPIPGGDGSANRLALDEATRQQLEALGYVEERDDENRDDE